MFLVEEFGMTDWAVGSFEAHTFCENLKLLAIRSGRQIVSFRQQRKTKCEQHNSAISVEIHSGRESTTALLQVFSPVQLP